MRPFVPLTLLAALAGGACSHSTAANPTAAAGDVDPLVKVPLVASTAEDAPQLLEITGAIKPDQASMVASDIAGRAIAVMVDQGDTVKQGDPLIRLDTSNASLSAQEVRAQLAAANAQLQLADADCKRAQQLLDKGAITKQQYDQETTSCTAAHENVAAIQARAAQVGKQITDGVVRAPFAGVIAQKMTTVGEWVAPGTPIVKLLDLDPLKVDISVPESAAAAVAVGEDAELDAVAFKDKKFHARITKVGAALTEMPRALVCEATIDPGTPLKPGMFVTVKIGVGKVKLPVVPKAAVVTKGTTSRLWAVVKGHLEERVVQLGPEMPGDRYAIAAGLTPGEKVAAQVTDQVADGARVE